LAIEATAKLPSPTEMVTYDYPGATSFTDLWGINADGLICGNFDDANGNRVHSFILRVHRGSGE
jgi:hypothetical protein